ARHVLGRRGNDVVVHHPRAVRRHAGGALDLPGRPTGRTLPAAVRPGKYLWLVLGDHPGAALRVPRGLECQPLVRREDTAAVTLPPPEQLVHPPAASPSAADSRTPPGASAPTAAPGVPPDPTRHLRVSLDLDDGARLWFVDQRTFGHLLVADLVPTVDGGPGGHGSPLPALPEPAAHIARDPLDPTLDRAGLARRLRTRRTEVKRALLDQSLVSGIGNIYADEALWRARLHPRRATDKLTQRAAVDVLAAAEDVMREALAAGGTSSDALYVDVEGASGWFARSLDAYGRAGEPCRRCGTLMRRESFMGRSSTFCPTCQRPPRTPRP